MNTKLINYGTRIDVTVEQASKRLITVIGIEIKEAFILINHGLESLPNVGDEGYIVFEKDSNKGHWQYYPKN